MGYYESLRMVKRQELSAKAASFWEKLALLLSIYIYNTKICNNITFVMLIEFDKFEDFSNRISSG